MITGRSLPISLWSSLLDRRPLASHECRKFYLLTKLSDNLDISARAWVDLLAGREQRLDGGRVMHAGVRPITAGLALKGPGCPNRHSYGRATPACQDRQPSGASDRRVRLHRQYSCEPAIEVIGCEGRNLGKWRRENRFQAYEGVSVAFRSTSMRKASKEQDRFPLNAYAITRRLCLGSLASLEPAAGSHFVNPKVYEAK
jgi:hypothetical protein